MRLILFLPFIAILILISIRSPYFGLLVFTWLAYMRPQNLIWAPDWRFSHFVAIALIIGYLFNAKKERIFVRTRESILIIAFWVILGACIFFSIWPSQSLEKFNELTKIFFIALATGAMINSKKRLDTLTLVIMLSLAFWGVKAGIRGAFFGWHIQGPEFSMIEDNNDFALALNMVIPFFLYFGYNQKTKWRKLFFYCQIPFLIFAVIYTYSRGGFLGLGVVMLLLILKSRRKFLGLLALGVALIGFIHFAPQDYKDRMQTIKTYETDESAMGRINAWNAAKAMIKDKPLTGVGLRNFIHAYTLYHPSEPKVAHNSYLQLGAESGLIALAVFVILLLLSIGKLRRLRKVSRSKPEFNWLCNYTHMLEVGLIGYMVSGFFLSRHDFDLLYQFIGMVVALEHIAKNEKLIAQ